MPLCSTGWPRRNSRRCRPELRKDLLDYFNDPAAPIAVKKNKKEWAKVTRE